MRLLGKYYNGNYMVSIYDDGTKIRENELSSFDSVFPENIDIKITNRCDMGCPMCHENSTPGGRNADLMGLKFIDSLQPYTELAIGGGNIFENPDLFYFLKKLKDLHIIANITVNQKHFEAYYSLIKYAMECKFVYGVGVSLVNATPEFIYLVKQAGPNVVIHTIVGLLTKEQINILRNNRLKILLLGYKDFGRGHTYLEDNRDILLKNMEYTRNKLDEILHSFEVVSFDNLAIEQLEPNRLLTEKEYDEFYMGDEGQFTMYVDAVNKQFAKNSISKTRYPLKDNIMDMFKIVKKEI